MTPKALSRDKVKQITDDLWSGDYSTNYLIRNFCEIIINLLLDIRDLLTKENK